MAVETTASAPVLDIDGTLARFGGDKNLFIDMSSILLEDSPRLIADLERAVLAKDAVAVRASAHAVKGLLAGCGGVRAARVAQSLEDAGLAGDLSKAPALVETLQKEFAQLDAALKEYRS